MVLAASLATICISTDIQKTHHHLGVCPQFDIQHADLTAKEHLLFYARLKGVKWRREKEVVEEALRQVKKIKYMHVLHVPCSLRFLRDNYFAVWSNSAQKSNFCG